MALKLENCCLCGDLRFGSLIFGYLHLIKDIIQILASVITLAIVGGRYNNPVPAFSATFLTFGIINLIFTAFLVHGLMQYKPGFVKTFLIYSGISTVISSILWLIVICLSEVFVLFVPGLLCLVFYIYVLLVIVSYYLKMDNAEVKSAIFNTTAGPFTE